MATITIYNQQGKKVKDLEVSSTIFDAEFNRDLVHQALERQLANGRLGMIAHTKTKGEVAIGTRKPKQKKGTGNARQGALNNPHMVGGGVAFGPRNNRNYNQMMPKKQRRLALFAAISQKLRDDKVFGLDKYESTEAKTKLFAETLSKLPFDKDLLIVLPAKNDLIVKSANNIPNVKTINVSYLNVADLQKYDKVVFLEDALQKMEAVFLQ